MIVPPLAASAFLTAKEACRALDVKASTLYAYVSRGLVRTAKGDERGKNGQKLYLREDIERLEKRAGARRGHAAVAGAALDWGEPVLDSRITRIDPEGPRYRGFLATDLVDRGHPFESIVHLLREGELPVTPVLSAVAAISSKLPVGLRPSTKRPIDRATELVAQLIFRAKSSRADADDAWKMLALLPWIVRPSGFLRAARLPTTAERILVALGRTPSVARQGLVNAALVLVADHELNVSAFTARVVASSGASLLAVVAAALHALSGAAHGGMCERIEQLVDTVAHPERARAAIRHEAKLRREIPGFGHPLYPRGDPRTTPLLSRALALGGKSEKLATLDAVVRAVRAELGLEPTIDLGLVAASYALRAPAGTGTALFAIGRTAGWLAHAEEQRRAGYLLRPRARYVGDPPRETPPPSPPR